MEEKKDVKNIIIIILSILVIGFAIAFVYTSIKYNKQLNADNEIKDNNKQKEDTNTKQREKNSRFRIPENDDTVLFAGSVTDIKEKIKNYELGKKWDNQTISLENGVKAEISCLSFDGPAGSDSYYCEKIKIQINQFTIDSYDAIVGCGDGNYIIVTKDHLITHKGDGCGTGLGIEMDDGIIISDGPTTLVDTFKDGVVYSTLNDNKLYFKEIDYDKQNDEGDNKTKIIAYDINTGNKEVMDTYYGKCSGQC